jgi:hypothetical protein
LTPEDVKQVAAWIAGAPLTSACSLIRSGGIPGPYQLVASQAAPM